MALREKNREEQYPADDEILKFIEKLIITLDENNEEFVNLLFCYRYYKFINCLKKTDILADEICKDAILQCSAKGY